MTAKTNRAIITIPGQAVPKGRPRTIVKKGKTWTYTPLKTEGAEEAIKWLIKNEIKTPLEGDIAMDMTFYVKGNRRGDLDNLIKLVLDAANKIAYKDDKQVKKIVASLLQSDEPHTEIEIKELGE